MSRKERRKREKNDLVLKKLRKSSTLVGSTLALSSVVSPVLIPELAHATEDTITSSEVEYTTVSVYDSQSQMSSDSVESTSDSAEDESTTESTVEDGTVESEITTQNDSLPIKPSIDSFILSPDSSETSEDKVENLSPFARFSTLPQTKVFSTAAFINEISGPASIAASENDLYASVMMAQAILESDWGRSQLGSAPNYNLFGIKGSYNGQSVMMSTWEHINGQDIVIDAAFRKYPSHLESFYDNAAVIKNTSFSSGVYYYSGAWKSNTSSYRDATAWLTGRYATDPNYFTKLNNIIETYNLSQYDTLSNGNGSTNTNTNTNTNTTDVVYTVKSGDSLWSLANAYGTSISNIKAWNNLSGNIIYIGQNLVVGKSTTNNNNTNTTNNNTVTNTSGKSYTVKSGDTLWAISNANGVSIANLKQWNNINGDLIYVGQNLIVSQGSTSSNGTTSSSSGNLVSNSNGTSYKVKSGDTLWSISKSQGTSINDLKQWNNLTSDMIYPNQSLIVKKDTTATSSFTRLSTNTDTDTTNVYTVKSGDTLWAISQNFGVSIQQIKQLNNLSGDTIFISQQLNLK